MTDLHAIHRGCNLAGSLGVSLLADFYNDIDLPEHALRLQGRRFFPNNSNGHGDGYGYGYGNGDG